MKKLLEPLPIARIEKTHKYIWEPTGEQLAFSTTQVCNTKTPEEMRNISKAEWRQYFKYESGVDEFTENWNDMVGVHIRSWYCAKSVFHNNSIFESEIDRLENKKFFFCSDNSDVQKYFIDKYGDRVITYDRQIFNNPQLAESGHHDDIQITTDAFIELLILSKCATIVGTYASSFDEVAWWMSGCKSKVIIPTPINCEKEYNDFNDLIYVKK